MAGRFFTARWFNANAEGMAGALQCAVLWTASATWPGRRRCCRSLRHLAALARRPSAVPRYAPPKAMLCGAVFCLFCFVLLTCIRKLL